MNPILSAYIGSGAMSAYIAFEIAARYPVILNGLTKWMLARQPFTLWFYALLAITGLILVTAGRRGSKLALGLARIGDAPALMYGGAGGGAFGWVLGASLTTITAIQSKDSLVAVIVLALVFSITAGPVLVFEIGRTTINEFNSKLFRASWRERLLQALGSIQVLAAFVGYWHEMRA